MCCTAVAINRQKGKWYLEIAQSLVWFRLYCETSRGEFTREPGWACDARYAVQRFSPLGVNCIVSCLKAPFCSPSRSDRLLLGLLSAPSTQSPCSLYPTRCSGRITQMWPNSWTTWRCCARIRASTKKWSTTTAAPWRSTSPGSAKMIPTWPKPRTTWWENSRHLKMNHHSSLSGRHVTNLFLLSWCHFRF